MRVELISDLHGNLYALDAALADARARGVDAVVCLGDVATLGPHPREVIDRVAALGTPAILGNHDEFLLDPGLLDRYTEAPIIRDAVAWCHAQLTDGDRAHLAGYLREHALTDGAVTLRLYHGTPRSHMEDLLATTPPELVDAMLAGRTAAVMAGGHTHVPMVRQHRGTWLVNPGSVGLAFREHVARRLPTLLPLACYAIVDLTPAGAALALHAVELDRSRLRAQATAVAHPMAAALAAAYA